VIDNRGSAIGANHIHCGFRLVVSASFISPGVGDLMFWMWHIELINELHFTIYDLNHLLSRLPSFVLRPPDLFQLLPPGIRTVAVRKGADLLQDLRVTGSFTLFIPGMDPPHGQQQVYALIQERGYIVMGLGLGNDPDLITLLFKGPAKLDDQDLVPPDHKIYRFIAPVTGQLNFPRYGKPEHQHPLRFFKVKLNGHISLADFPFRKVFKERTVDLKIKPVNSRFQSPEREPERLKGVHRAHLTKSRQN